jgi:hypothetical protein
VEKRSGDRPKLEINVGGVKPYRTSMRKRSWGLLIVLFALPCIAAKKTTVDQLRAVLAELQQQNRTDEIGEAKLKDITLTEQLTPAAMDSLAQYHPGPLTKTRLRVLAGESAMLLPPASELPTDAAPDRNTQTAIVNRVIDYVVHRNSQLPRLSAQREIMRFQSGSEPVATNSGTFSNFATTNLGNTSANRQYLDLLNTYTSTVQSERGIELPPQKPPKKQNPASQSGQMTQGGAGLVLGLVLMDASKHDLTFERWQLIDGKKTAVFSFRVDAADSHYKVNYCCFPIVENIGGAGSVNASPIVPSMMAQPGGTAVSYKPFSATPGYHGEFFVDPDTGVILRLGTSAELKPTDIVHHEDIRIDYGSVSVDGKLFVVPLRSYTLVELSPNGDALVKDSTRRALFDTTYKSYIMADVPKAK